MRLETVFLSVRPIVESLARSTMRPCRAFSTAKRKPSWIALACSKPPKGRTRWTLRLLENKVVELGALANRIAYLFQQAAKPSAQLNIREFASRNFSIHPAGGPDTATTAFPS